MDAIPAIMVAVMIAIGMIVVVSVITHMLTLHQNARAAYRRIAEDYGGQFEGGNLWQGEGRVVRFHHDGFPVKLEEFRMNTSTQKEVKFQRVCIRGWQDGSARFEVYPQRFYHRIIKLVGMQDIIIGSPDFDDHYIISGNDPAMIREILTPTVQEMIDSLRRLGGNDDIYVQLLGGELEIRKRPVSAKYEFLSKFTHLGLTLWNVAQPSPDAGIEFVQGAYPTEPAVCQVCGEEMNDKVYCSDCRTPHHSDCWEYYGGCSVYACGGKRSLKSQARRSRWRGKSK